MINEETSISIEIDVSSFIKVFNYAKLFFIFISTIIELHFLFTSKLELIILGFKLSFPKYNQKLINSLKFTNSV
ncbi:Uncharacterised protein [Staphylococcus cohnii subsp. cohnii]|nr:Uncharacterised protein [Staphylococcus cohnii subsp. cohnii]